MKQWISRCLAVLLVCSLVLSAGCAGSEALNVKREVPGIVRTGGNRDLLEEAVSLSGYAESGLSGLESFGYGEGKFDDYLEMQGEPLTSADYVLSAQKAARKVNIGGQGVVEFYRHVLKKTGFRYETMEKYPVHNDLGKALQAVYAAAGETCPDTVVEAAEATVSLKAQKPLARWLSAAAAAFALVKEQTGELTDEQFTAIAAFTYTRCATSDTAELERMRNIASDISEEAMQQAGEILVEATAQLAGALADFQVLTKKDEQIAVPTPLGDVVLGSSGVDTYASPQALLLLDPAGEDVYNGRVAAGSSRMNCLSVLLDLAGNDTYAAGNEPAQGCGILGVGVLLDMQGDDTYFSKRLAQGCALIGAGLLYDGQGNDSYTCYVTGQGAGFYGTAMLLDGDGDDAYTGYGFVQASAGHRCVAYLVDGAGNDRYDTPEDVPTGYDRLDYGSGHEGKNGGFSQGCGWGQRSIGENGLAGGIAGMVDFAGDDVYTGGLWVQGTGYWSGIGFVYNEGGNDEYNAYYYSQASVAHYGAGMLVDTLGNDKYTLARGAGMSFVWDRGVSLLVDDSGDDGYTCHGSHGGVANSYYDEKGVENQDLTYAIFLEAGGTDRYVRDRSSESYGYGRGGYFLEVDGEDVYFNQNSPLWGNGSITHGQEFQKGGVYIDASRAEESVPYAAFWEKAKKAAGFGKVK